VTPISVTQIPIEQRIASNVDKTKFLGELRKLQIPCPWGDLNKGEGLEALFVGDSMYIPHIPLGLAVGCGYSNYENGYKGLAQCEKIGKIIYSDIIHPMIMPMPANYIIMDLTKPETINLDGMQVHAIMSISVFTYDHLGVQFQDKETEINVAEAISDLIMPGGIFVSDSIISSRFEKIMQRQFDFKQVGGSHSIENGLHYRNHSSCLQKLF
jgi:hypothetical protein